MMATARELLEQADALMRKNRSRAEAADIPVLTDVVEVPPAPASSASRADVPVLTDVIEALAVEIPPLPEPQPPAALFEGDPSDWLVMDTVDPAIHSVTGRAPDTLAVVPPVTLKAAGSAATPPPEGSQRRPPQEETPAPDFASQADAPRSSSSAEFAAPENARDAEIELEPQPGPDEIEQRAAFEPPIERLDDLEQASSHDAALQSSPMLRTAEHDVLAQQKKEDDERWAGLAEQISMQVLQRIDLFTETGLREKLSTHLQPIVERAGAELVAAINEHVGRLLRAYIAEAIEREIAQWRDGQH